MALWAIYPNCRALSTGVVEASGLPTLHDRRTSLCMNFSSALKRSSDFNHWLPKTRQTHHTRNLRNSHKLYVPKISRTVRHSSSPAVSFTRLISGDT